MVTWEMFYGTGYFRRLFGHSTTRVTHLNPFIVIVAVIIGTHLFGIIGTLIAVPLLLMIISVLQAVKN